MLESVIRAPRRASDPDVNIAQEQRSEVALKIAPSTHRRINKLQSQTQPMEKSGAVPGGESIFCLISYNPVKEVV